MWRIFEGEVPGPFWSNYTPPGGASIAMDVDCESQQPHTLVKALASGPSTLVFNATAGTISFAGGMCLNTGQGPAIPPCSHSQEKWLPNQIQLAPCSDPSAAGWTTLALS